MEFPPPDWEKEEPQAKKARLEEGGEQSLDDVVNQFIMEAQNPGDMERAADALLDDFIKENELDDMAIQVLKSSSIEVQCRVLELGPVTGARNPSANLVSRIKEIKSQMSALVLADPVTGGNIPEDFTFGYIKEPSRNGEFCFIVLEGGATDEVDTVYCHKTVADPSILAPNQPVAFKLHVNDKGKKQASRPLFRLLGKATPGAEVSWGEFQGVVTKVNANGTASVQCEDCLNKHGKEAYAHGAVVSECALRDGDIIRFDVYINPKGSPQVSLPVWKECKKGEAQQLEGHFFTGIVKSRNIEGGFSLIHCPETGRRKDVYAHKTLVDPEWLNDGEFVAFKVHWNKSGDPQAQLDAPFWKLAGGRQQQRPPPFGNYIGVVRKILLNGCGFIDSPKCTAEFQHEPYVFSSILEECQLTEGEVISFDTHVNNKGEPQLKAPCWKCINPQQAWAEIEKVLHGAEGKGDGKGDGKGYGKAKGKGGDSWDGGGKGKGKWGNSWDDGFGGGGKGKGKWDSSFDDGHSKGKGKWGGGDSWDNVWGCGSKGKSSIWIPGPKGDAWGGDDSWGGCSKGKGDGWGFSSKGNDDSWGSSSKGVGFLVPSIRAGSKGPVGTPYGGGKEGCGSFGSFGAVAGKGGKW